MLAGLEPRVRIASSLLVAAYGVWLLLAPFERTLHAQLWMPAALSLDNLGAGVAPLQNPPTRALAPCSYLVRARSPRRART